MVESTPPRAAFTRFVTAVTVALIYGAGSAEGQVVPDSLGAGPIAEPPQALPTPPEAAQLSAADAARRERVVARAGDAFVTVGDVEDALLHGSPDDVRAYGTPSGRTVFLRNLLRIAVLAREAERRGLVHGPLRYRAERDARRVAIDRMIAVDFDARRFSPPPATPPAPEPETRRAVVLFATSQQTVAAWLREVEGRYHEQALAMANDVPGATVVDTDWVPREGGPELEERIRNAMFGVDSVGHTSTPTRLADGRYVGLILVGLTLPQPAPSAEDEARRQSLLARDRALEELRRDARAHVRFREPAALDGVVYPTEDTVALQRLEGRYHEPEVERIPVEAPTHEVPDPRNAPR